MGKPDCLLASPSAAREAHGAHGSSCGGGETAGSPLTHLIQARGLGIRFGRHWALAHVDLDLPAGERLVLAGANGSGKTTLLRLIAGLLQPTAGELLVLGSLPRKDPAAARRRLSLVSHHDYLYDRLTAMETLVLWSRLRHGEADSEGLGLLLEEVGLAPAANRRVGDFSAGMRKRLILARSRVEHPDLLLLDEPFAALDPEGQAMVEGWIRRFTGDGGSLIIASHALRQSSSLCRRAILLARGQIAWHGAASELDAAWRRSRRA